MGTWSADHNHARRYDHGQPGTSAGVRNGRLGANSTLADLVYTWRDQKPGFSMPKRTRRAGDAQQFVSDPFPSVVSTAQIALELFTLSLDIPLRNDVPTTSSAPRTTRTTTVSSQSALISRAIHLMTLAQGNLAFFRENGFG